MCFAALILSVPTDPAYRDLLFRTNREDRSPDSITTDDCHETLDRSTDKHRVRTFALRVNRKRGEIPLSSPMPYLAASDLVVSPTRPMLDNLSAFNQGRKSILTHGDTAASQGRTLTLTGIYPIRRLLHNN